MKQVKEELIEFLEEVTESFSNDGGYNHYTAPLSTTEIREQAAALLKRLRASKS